MSVGLERKKSISTSWTDTVSQVINSESSQPKLFIVSCYVISIACLQTARFNWKCATQAACKYVKSFQPATSWLCVYTLMSELPEGRGNILQRHEAEVFHRERHWGFLIELFYLWSRPHVCGISEQQYRKWMLFPRGNNRKKEGFITQLFRNSSVHYCVIQWC